MFVDSSKANYNTMQNSSDVSMAPIWGNANTGAHATFTKFKPGYDAGMHTHTNDVWIVVIKCAYLYKDEDGQKRVGPGDFLCNGTGAYLSLLTGNLCHLRDEAAHRMLTATSDIYAARFGNTEFDRHFIGNSGRDEFFAKLLSA